jgi:endoglucanase
LPAARTAICAVWLLAASWQGISEQSNRAASSTLSRAEATAVPESRFNHLRHGINLSHWFAQSNSYDQQHLSTYDTEKDFDLIRSMGFDHVRFTIEPAPIFRQSQPDKLDEEYLHRIDDVVQMALARNLAIILDIHPSDEFKQKLQAEKQVENFTDFWRSFAAHFASTDPERVFFEILNEPEVFDEYRWLGIQARIVEQVRKVAPRHTIIVAAGAWSGLDDLLTMEPLRDSNVIYNFHFYTPFLFTHQGATWTSELQHHLTRVHYPSYPGSDAELIGLLPEFRQRIQVVRYDEDRWDASRIEAEIAQAASWAADHKVRLTCNEFGVLRTNADPAERAAWLHDVRSSLEAHHIGWTMWDYAGGFAVAPGEPGARTPDMRMLQALGLK